MRIFELLDPNVLQDHLNARRVSTQFHPTLPLVIYNYTHLAQFDPHWGDGTIDYCRGLIVNRDNHEIVSRPFKKFHNLNTPSIPATMEENLPPTAPSTTKKLDGSLGILYALDGFEGVATRGSFVSPPAKWATARYNQLKATAAQKGLYFRWPHGYTPLFEIIYNENRIVVQYPFEDLVLIGLVNNETGNEMSPAALRREGRSNNFRVVEEVVAIMEELKEANKENEEGYVLTYRQSNQDPLKIKIKMADYVRLHRIVTGMNPRSVWERLKAGQDLREFETGYSAPFTKWLMNWKDKLLSEWSTTVLLATDAYTNRPFYSGDPRKSRAEFASYVKTCIPCLKNILFMMYDGKDTSAAIWNLIEPRGDDKTFREEGE